MSNSIDLAEPVFSISAVERDTGLSKDTLRVWERRYEFPLPGRDVHGERIYTRDQVEKLRAIKRLLDRGQRPSKLVGLSLDELRERSEAVESEPVRSPGLAHFLALVKAHQVDALRQRLGQAIMREGLAGFLVETVAPLNEMVGEAWMRGDFEVFEEHLYTEVMQGILRRAIAGIPQQGRTPRIVLTTPPNEQHALGLMMAEALLALEGATCISLGTQTPVWDIVHAAAAQRANIVALSLSIAFPANLATEALADLRSKLPPDTLVWVGGSNPGPQRRQVAGIIAFRALAEIPEAVARWREGHAQGAPSEGLPTQAGAERSAR